MLNRSRLCALAVTIGVVAVAAFTTGGSAGAASSVHYVALGDSYSSGDGAGHYSDGSCRESSNAYPVLWAAANAPALRVRRWA